MDRLTGTRKRTSNTELCERLEQIEATLHDMKTTLNLLIHLLGGQDTIDGQAAEPQETNDNGD